MLDFGFYNMDCMEGMKEFPDKFFDLAIVDPPYGIDKDYSGVTRIGKYGDMKTVNDMKPDAMYFKELFRVSKNQIVWGYNHLSDLLPPTKEFIFWYKHQPVISYSDGELAWTSFHKTARCFNYPYFGTVGADAKRIHPTQKPVALYTWLLNTYSKKDDIILDTHVGSASSLVACYRKGLKFVGFEISEFYFNLANDRLKAETHRKRLF